MIIHSAEFIKSAPDLKSCPDFGGIPEIVFVGRSNVGKSSCINSLLNRKNIAKTSNTPGKTRLINFYKINNAFALVDLPGYGYAKVSHQEQEKWRANLESFLLKRQSIGLVIQLIDARHPPQPLDAQMLEWLMHYGLPWHLVFTKIDKLTTSQQNKVAKEASQSLGIIQEMITVYSSETHRFRDALWRIIQPYAEGKRERFIENFDQLELDEDETSNSFS
ncbi:MAG: ribosome biogenesis GTP-binding protein YihA/YsxC [Cyanobacteria bacterium]|nr:ribosome biogenesis GTP-binding protein YihA/YsxC [Cyanobacteriota bacterium]